MARKLPWATKDHPSSQVKPPRALPKHRKASFSSDEKLEKKTKSATPLRSTRKRAKSRTASTSPPPGPPEEEYMLEGYDGDDIYIMVEDEFHSIAQSFTTHLHHAEYQRLKKKAKDAALPNFQPTEQMRVEVKKKVEARALRERQKEVVENVTNGAGLSAEDDEEEDDPWLGTSLAGLMMEVGNQKRTALVGLEKMQSSTRAAKGFARGAGAGPLSTKKQLSVFDVSGGASGQQDNDGDKGYGSRVDDLNDASMPSVVPASTTVTKPSPTNERKAKPKPWKLESTFETVNDSSKPSRAEVGGPSTINSRSGEPSASVRRLFDDFDDLGKGQSNPRTLGRQKKSSLRTESRPGQQKGKGMQLNDVPTFLV